MVGTAGTGILIGAGTKSSVIQLLSEEWPLSSKEIHNQLCRKHSFSGSYQAVHKTLQELEKAGVLQKADSKYALSHAWAKQVSAFGKKLEQGLTGKTNGNGSTKTLVFDSFIGLGQFIINDFFNYTDSEGKGVVCLWNHAYPIAGMVTKQEHETLKELFSKGTNYSICYNETCLDKLTMDYLKGLGKSTSTGIPASTKTDTFIKGDYVMQVFFAPETEKEMRKIYSSIKTKQDIDMQKMFEFGSRKTQIKAALFQNAEFADSFREEARLVSEKYAKGEIVEKEFSSFIEFGRFLINDFFTEKSARDTVPCACLWKHAYPVVGASQEEHEKMKNLFSNPEHYAICESSTYLDNLTSEYTKKLGKKSVIGKKFSAKLDTFIEGDKILQVCRHKEFEEDLEKMYSEIVSEREFDMQKLLDFGSKTRTNKLKVKIFRNKELAESLMQEAKKLYEQAHQKAVAK